MRCAREPRTRSYGPHAEGNPPQHVPGYLAMHGVLSGHAEFISRRLTASLRGLTQVLARSFLMLEYKEVPSPSTTSQDKALGLTDFVQLLTDLF